MAMTIDSAKVSLVRTIANDKVGFWSGAIDGPGMRLFAGGTDFRIHVFDLPAIGTSKTASLVGHESYVTGLVYSPAFGVLVSGGFDKRLIWWRPGGQAEPIRKIALDGRVNRLALSLDGNSVVSATDDLVARLWDTQTGKLIKEYGGKHPLRTRMGRNNTLYSVAFAPNGKRLATGDRAGSICVWDIDSADLVFQTAAPAFYSVPLKDPISEYEWGGVRSLAFTPDGSMLIAGGMGPADQTSAGIDGAMRVEVLDGANGKSLAAFLTPEHKGLLNSMLFHPDKEWLIAAGGGGQAGDAGVGSIGLWNRTLRDEKGNLRPPAMIKSVTVVREVLVTPDGKSLLALGMQKDLTAGRIEVWDLTGTVPAPVSAAKESPKK